MVNEQALAPFHVVVDEPQISATPPCRRTSTAIALASTCGGTVRKRTGMYTSSGRRRKRMNRNGLSRALTACRSRRRIAKRPAHDRASTTSDQGIGEHAAVENPIRRNDEKWRWLQQIDDARDCHTRQLHADCGARHGEPPDGDRFGPWRRDRL